MMGYSLYKYRIAVFTSGLSLIWSSGIVLLIAEILNRFAFLLLSNSNGVMKYEAFY